VRVLALDLSTHVGWAFFEKLDARPIVDTWHVPRNVDPDRLGLMFLAFERWLVRKLDDLAPDVLGIEAPILPRGRTFKKTKAIRMSWGFATVAEMVADRRGLRCIEAHPATVKLVLSGSGRAKKPAMIVAAIERGMIDGDGDGDQADACGVALVIYEHIGLGV
jgi:Holliday junction resolvasome RuvABC endonuclease subunit